MTLEEYDESAPSRRHGCEPRERFPNQSFFEVWPMLSFKCKSNLLAVFFLLTLGAAAPAAAPEKSAAAAAKAIAHHVHTGTLEEASAAMAEAYAWAGVSIVDAKGTSIAKGVTPTIPVTMRSFEMQKAAIAARGEPTTDLADLAKLVVDLGGFLVEEASTAGIEAAGQDFAKQFEGMESPLDGELAGIVFVEILGQMIRASRAAPTSPHNFVPLLLEAMAKERATRDGGRAVDLASGEAHPEDVVLTLTEAELFFLMFPRRATSYAELSVRYASLDMPILAAPGTTCSDLVDKLGDYAKASVPHAADYVGGKMVETFYWLFKEETGKAISESLQLAVGYAWKAARLMKWLLDTSEFELTPSPKSAHWSHSENKEVEVTFKAEVSLPSGGDRDSAEAAGCLNTLFGFNIPDSPEALAKSMKDWRVYWNFEKLGEHGTVSSAKNAFQYHAPLGGGLKVSGTKGTSEVIVDLAHEQPKADLRAEQKKGTIRVTASLDQSASFDPTFLFKAGKASSGASAVAAAGKVKMGAVIFADVLIDVLVEWGKKAFPPKANATVNVTWHEPTQFTWEGTISEVTTLSGARDLTEKTPGRAPPAIAIGVTIAPPASGTETFHDEGSASRTMSVKVNGGREGERIHEYRFVSNDHAKSTRKEQTPEVCSTENGKSWNVGTWTTDYLETIDIHLKGSGFTTVKVTFKADGSYLIDAPIPYASGDFISSDSYLGESSCTGETDPDSRPLRPTKRKHKVGPFRLSASGKAKPDAKVLSDSVTEPIEPDGHLGTKGSVTTTWNLKKIEVK